MVSTFSGWSGSVEDDLDTWQQISVRTSETIEQIRDLVTSDRRLNIRLLSNILDIDKDVFRKCLFKTQGNARFARDSILSAYQRNRNKWEWELVVKSSVVFSKLKISLKGTRFLNIYNIKENVKFEIKSIPKDDFAICFKQFYTDARKSVLIRRNSLRKVLNSYVLYIYNSEVILPVPEISIYTL